MPTPAKAAASRTAKALRLGLAPELVADTRHRDQVSGVAWVVAEFATQVLHVSVDRPLVALVVVALYPRYELVTRVDLPRTGGERNEQVELAPREATNQPSTRTSCASGSILSRP